MNKTRRDIKDDYAAAERILVEGLEEITHPEILRQFQLCRKRCKLVYKSEKRIARIAELIRKGVLEPRDLTKESGIPIRSVDRILNKFKKQGKNKFNMGKASEKGGQRPRIIVPLEKL